MYRILQQRIQARIEAVLAERYEVYACEYWRGVAAED